MLKSIMLVFAGAVLIAGPLAVAGRGAQQAATTPAATPATPAATPATALPAADAAVTPTLGDTTGAGPSVPGDMKNPVVKPTADSQAKAKQLYSIDCSMCHGDNGNGKTDLATGMGVTLPDLTDAKTLADVQDGTIFNLIRNGKDKMPDESKGRAPDTEVWNLVIYVRSLSKPLTAAAAAK